MRRSLHRALSLRLAVGYLVCCLPRAARSLGPGGAGAWGRFNAAGDYVGKEDFDISRTGATLRVRGKAPEEGAPESLVAGIDECVRTMSEGGIRRIVVPAEIGYPADGFKRVGPKPSTFSGERALDFVLSSKDDLMDKTLMFDLKLVSVTPRASQ